MKLFYTLSIALLSASLFTLHSCKQPPPMGTKIKEPFSGNKYESTGRYFRSVGKGDSQDENVAKSKADLQAKKELAQQVGTRMKVVTDQYLAETEVNNASELNDKFQSLVREVTNTEIADLRKIGEEKYLSDEKIYTVYIAYEIQKRDMYRFMKRQAKLDKKLSEAERKSIEEIIDEELRQMEASGDE
ncbi:MAG: hypothetical protein IT223_11185 [Crocinitomicaceae bacterium]|nr:hypothetical protein [Crocinitomicaceae bacterium]